MRRRREPPTIEQVRWVRGIAAPGAAATTIGRTVFVAAGVELTERLRRHEYEHVRQFHDLGRARFLADYVAQYLRWRLRRHGHHGAYLRIDHEVRAEWRARRALGIGVVGPRPGAPHPAP